MFPYSPLVSFQLRVSFCLSPAPKGKVARHCIALHIKSSWQWFLYECVALTTQVFYMTFLVCEGTLQLSNNNGEGQLLFSILVTSHSKFIVAFIREILMSHGIKSHTRACSCAFCFFVLLDNGHSKWQWVVHAIRNFSCEPPCAELLETNY